MLSCCSRTLVAAHRMVALMTLLILMGSAVHARQFRAIKPIATQSVAASQLPEGAVAVAQVQPLSRDEVEPYVQTIIGQWNTTGMAQTLSEQFHDKDRLLDVMDTAVPRDAKLRIQSIQGVQTLQQYLTPGKDSARMNRVSIVSATVRTQLEFNNNGFVRLPGTNEFIIEVSQAAPP